jgi:hypothetical protein
MSLVSVSAFPLSDGIRASNQHLVGTPSLFPSKSGQSGYGGVGGTRADCHRCDADAAGEAEKPGETELDVTEQVSFEERVSELVTEVQCSATECNSEHRVAAESGRLQRRVGRFGVVAVKM